MAEAAVKEKPAADAQQELTDGFHLIIDALKLNGLNTIYGVPGIPITDFGRMAQAEGIRVLSFRHEQNAGYAASIAGYLTKKPGVCLTVSAPGFLNGLTALAHATTNCFPMILISGSSEREIVDLQQGDYEEMDQLAIAKPLCKAAFRVLHAADIGIGVARAIRAAVSGRPGGVYLDLPAKLFGQVMNADAGRKSLVKVIDPAPVQIPAPDAIKRALDVLKSAKRPLIILGKGAAYAQADDAVRSFVEKSGVPFLPMSMAKGLLPDTHPQCAGAARSTVLKDADVVMLIGARLNWLLSHGKGKTWGEPHSKKFIQIDIEPREMDSNIEIAAPLVGDIGSCVAALLRGMGDGWKPPSAEWTNEARTCSGLVGHSAERGRIAGSSRMNETEIRKALERHWAASDASDFEIEHDIYQEDAVLEYPQSGERIRGRRNIQASRVAQPSAKRFTVRRMIGAGDLWVTEFILAYDGRPSYSVSVMEFLDGKVARETQYFADSFEPGPSRAQWVERMG